MSDSLMIQANNRHEYYARASILGYEVDLLLDSAFVHSRCLVGVSLDDTAFRAIRPLLHELGDTEV